MIKIMWYCNISTHTLFEKNWGRFFLVVFTRKAVLARVLKKRYFVRNKVPTLKYGTIGICCASTFRFEYKYCLFFRKFFKKMFKTSRKKISTVVRRKTWFFIRPNYVLTRKSKNARMGKGKGNFKRWCTVVYPGSTFIEHTNVPLYFYKKYIHKMRLKLKLKFNCISDELVATKCKAVSGVQSEPTNYTTLTHVRKQIKKSLFV